MSRNEMRNHWLHILNLRVVILMGLLSFSLPAYAKTPRTRQHQMKKRILLARDIEYEIQFGREIAAHIIGRYGLYYDKELTRYVNLIGRSISRAANRPEIRFTVGILDTDCINAYAAPGGFIFVTRGVIESIDDEAQLAGVIAHEIIHITQRHILRELNISTRPELSTVCVLTQIIGGTGDPARIAITKMVDETITILFDRGYHRDDEMEADTLGVILASSAGYDPSGLARYLGKIEKLSEAKVSSYKRLYPPIEERIRYISKAMKQEGLSAENSGYIIGEKRFSEYTH